MENKELLRIIEEYEAKAKPTVWPWALAISLSYGAVVWCTAMEYAIATLAAVLLLAVVGIVSVVLYRRGIRESIRQPVNSDQPTKRGWVGVVSVLCGWLTLSIARFIPPITWQATLWAFIVTLALFFVCLKWSEEMFSARY